MTSTPQRTPSAGPQLSRRAALRWLGIGGIGLGLAACSPTPPRAEPAATTAAGPAAAPLAPTQAPAAAATQAPAPTQAVAAPTTAATAIVPAQTTSPTAAPTTAAALIKRGGTLI